MLQCYVYKHLRESFINQARKITSQYEPHKMLPINTYVMTIT